MPYTPPSLRSPANSAPSSPDVSRRSSLQTAARPSLPRSASYLTRTRRGPSAVGGTNAASKEPTPPGTYEDLKSLNTLTSVRQSPPPVTDAGAVMPSGAVISPPDSAAGSDEEENGDRNRQLNQIKELKEAISQIPLRREVAPTVVTDVGAVNSLGIHNPITDGIIHSLSTTALDNFPGTGLRRTHSRSATEPKVQISKSAETSFTGSEEESEEDLLMKPPMVRKKSGELVRPALRAASRRRPSSMPGTPTFSKAVHFDSHLEHVRHFLQVDRPLAVSAGSSPVDNYDSETEFPFPGSEKPEQRTPPFEWEIVTSNQPFDTPLRRAQPVRLEKVWLSPDQKSMLGSVSVSNLAFHKNVTCRFTLDYWKTTSEVNAEWTCEIRDKDAPHGYDRFTFTIKLSDTAHLETKTLYFCIRYNVIGQEFWDNNDTANFQVDFRKKHLPQNGKRSLQGAGSRPVGGLPRSNRRPGPPPTSKADNSKPKPSFAHEFGDPAKYNFDQPIHEFLGESGLRLKNNKSTGCLASDNLSARLPAPSGQAFANRYDFGASLSAAVQAAKDSMSKEKNSDALYMKSHRKISLAPEQPPKLPAAPVVKTAAAPAVAAKESAPVVPGTSSPNTLLASSSYEELVNKYCFFGSSKQSSPQMTDGSLKGARFDGSGDGSLTRGSNSTTSSTQGSPNQIHHAGPALHHTLYHRDHRPYLGATGGSPATSPQNNFTLSNDTSGGFAHMTGTSPNLPYAPQFSDRHPFFGNEAHTATAIRG